MNNLFALSNLIYQIFNKNSLNLHYTRKGSLSVGVINTWRVLNDCLTYFFNLIIT
jgi:uncharacterized membrane protein YpjA